MIKVCGVRDPGERGAAAAGGADLVGVWCGVPGGHANLRPERAAALLAGGARQSPQPVLVTLRGRDLPSWADELGARWVQLHGFQPPGSVAALKERGMTVVKVLHLDGDECPEERLVSAYHRAGTDWFLLDTTTPGGRLGSTGRTAPPSTLRRVADLLERPFLLAGGVRADNRESLRGIVDHPRFAGIDVDSATRDSTGRMTAARVAALVAAWHPVVEAPCGS